MPRRGPYLNHGRYWAGFPSWTGLGRKALIPPGEVLATDDPDVAAKLYADKIRELEAARRGINLGLGAGKNLSPAEYAERYLRAVAQLRREKAGLRAEAPLPPRAREAWSKTKHSILLCLDAPPIAKLSAVRQIDYDAFGALLTHLKTRVRSRKGELLTPGAVRRIAMEFSGMLTEAKREGYLSEHPNRERKDVPAGERHTALSADEYLTRPEVRGLLNGLRYSSKNPWAIEQGTTFYYTGARLTEMATMLASDFDFLSGLVYFPLHGHRSMKTSQRRELPFWPRLRAVMELSFELVPRNPNGLAFPVLGTEMLPFEEQIAMQRLRGSLVSAAMRAGITKPIGHHTARHSYVSARQTMVEIDAIGHERAVLAATIAREVGHADESMIRDVYGHLPKEAVRQVVLDWGEDDPREYMRTYRDKRKRLAARNERRRARAARRAAGLL